jgi:ketosteroid isomerase-like protein
VAAHEHTEDLRRELAPQHLHRAGHRARHRACDGSPLTGPYAHGTVRYTLAPPLVQGPDTAYGDADGLRTWFATFDGPIEISYRDAVVIAAGDVAFTHALTSMTATQADAPEPFTLWFRSTFGLRRIDGDWRIVHQHESTPFYMDGSFKAAVDLTP